MPQNRVTSGDCFARMIGLFRKNDFSNQTFVEVNLQYLKALNFSKLGPLNDNFNGGSAVPFFFRLRTFITSDFALFTNIQFSRKFTCHLCHLPGKFGAHRSLALLVQHGQPIPPKTTVSLSLIVACIPSGADAERSSMCIVERIPNVGVPCAHPFQA